MRSPHLMSRRDTALVLIDLQEKLVPVVIGADAVVASAGFLVQGALSLGMPILVTEQYPRGLGHTIAPLRQQMPEGTPIVEKRTFSAGGPDGIVSLLEERQIRRVLLAGIETHVCVQQSALDFMAHGFSVFVAVDAVTSGRSREHELGLARMASCGVTLTTSESALFEWTETAAAEEFKQISALVKERRGREG